MRRVCSGGVAAALNDGIALATGRYIARMDADDISTPERFRRQIEFMDGHPEVGACGAWAREIDADGNVVGTRRAPAGKSMQRNFWRPSPIIHPTAMIRRSLPDLRYEPSLVPAEDYDLWLRIWKSARLANLPEYLLLYRVHPESSTGSRREEQLLRSYEVFCRHFNPGSIDCETFLRLVLNPREMTVQEHCRAHWGLARGIGLPYRVFLSGEFRHLRRRLKRKAGG